MTHLTASRAMGGAVALALVALLWLPASAHAHERREVAGYQFVVGFFTEPAIEGVSNAVSVRVSVPGDQPSPVEGLEQTLEVEVTHVETNVARAFALHPRFNDPGHYVADLIPTAPGQYSFRFFGTIEGTAIDELFTSGDDTFNNVEAALDLQFPTAAAPARELEAGVRGATADAADAADDAARARTLAIAGIVVGALGLIAGVGGVAAGMRRRA